MARRLVIIICVLLSCVGIMACSKQHKDLTIRTRIDSVYVFGFDLTESRSAKGGIWNLKTGKPETPLNYTKAKQDTLNGVPVVMLYREVVRGNHPLNRWEPWILKEEKWMEFEQ